MNFASADTSRRLRLTLEALQPWGSLGATTAEIQMKSGSMAVSTDISELRKNGYVIKCEFERRTETGRKVFRYFYLGRAVTE